MSIFIDTSGLLAMLVENDINHERAAFIFNRLLDQSEPLVTTNYVIVETIALLQRRIGLQAVRILLDRVIPALEIEWMNSDLHAESISSLLIANRRLLSIVDCSSFVVIQRMSITTIFTFDEHFEQQGYICLN